MRSRATRRDRIERESQARRARAHAHLERVRRGRGGAPSLALRPRPALVVALFAAGVAGGLWLSGTAFAAWDEAPRRLRRVAVRGAERLSPAEVAAAGGISGAASAPTDPDAAVRALESHDWIASARAVLLPGGTLVLEIEERRAAAATWIGSTPFAVDADGRPFAPLSREEAEGLLLLRSARPPTPREPHPELARAIAVARALPARGLAAPREIAVAAEEDPDGLVLQLPGLAAEFVLGAEAPSRRIDALAELLARRPVEVATAGRVDLRFEGQAVLSGVADPGGKAQEATRRGGAAASQRKSRG